ncbi:hypothetical protein CTW00_01791 [Streptococcus iniae]|uniref:DUF1697 domain-containing protein n=1 Tax=Streptococcus iniae TaxID=1346 RepID=UPI0002E19C13|nr:DUF1697 domain-containing protein [Streptococcus iniae]AJG26164.1 hypothetical protein SI82_06120 [Streptococcus iniae]ATX39967.1 hypothetical protein CTW00_01791 [Streptococcus iniae]
MKAYLLLLRAINVGGRHKVSMADLKLLLITLGLERVKSYINSGNLYFESYHDKDDLYGLLKALFNSHYDFPIPFVIIEKQTLTEEYSSLPKWWHKDHFRKNVLFLLPSQSSHEVQKWLETVPLAPKEQLVLKDLALYWAVESEEAYSSYFYHKGLIKTSLYQEVTIRNARTSSFLAYEFGKN